MNVVVERENIGSLNVLRHICPDSYRDNQANYSLPAAHLILTLETKLANFPSFGFILQIVILSVSDTPRPAKQTADL